jgi:hypothetical protein
MAGPEFGGVAPVVNWLVRFPVSAFPYRSVIAVVAITVIVEDTGNVVLSIAVRLSEDIAMRAERFESPTNRASVVLVTVAGFTECENVTDTAAFWPTPVVPFAGVTEVMVSGVTAGVVTGV